MLLEFGFGYMWCLGIACLKVDMWHPLTHCVLFGQLPALFLYGLSQISLLNRLKTIEYPAWLIWAHVFANTAPSGYIWKSFCGKNVIIIGISFSI